MQNVWRNLKGRAASFLVVAYALAVLLPSLAFSFDRDVSIVHSLAEVHGGLLIPHFHHDDAGHGDQDQSDHQAPTGTHHCCGALSITGLLPVTEVAVVDPVCSLLISSVPEDQRVGCDPARLDRPPRLLTLI